MKLKIMKFEQPVGEFYLTVINGDDLIKMSKAKPRVFNDDKLESSDGIQREPSIRRIKEISEYAKTFDASFPTPVILALDEGDYNIEKDSIEIKENVVAEIIDGQHRIEGIKESGTAKEFEIPVVLILNPTVEQKALIFATINGKQTKVPASIVYDLFGISKGRSPYKTAHEIARAINSMEESPWYRKLKMLGKNTGEGGQSLSQGTFVKNLLIHISNKPDEDRDIIMKGMELPIRNGCVFNEYFRNGQDEIILKILINIFNAVKETWPNEWQNSNEFILRKSTGFIAIMKSIPTIYELGKNKNDLSKDFFLKIFSNAKSTLKKENKELNSISFPPGARSERELAKIFSNSEAN